MFKSSPSVPVTRESGTQETEGTTRRPKLKLALLAGAALFAIVCIILVVVYVQKTEVQVQPSPESLLPLTGRPSKTGFQVESFTEGPYFVMKYSGTPLHGLFWQAYNNPHVSIPILIGVILAVVLAIAVPLVLVLGRSKVPEIERQPDQNPVTMEDQGSSNYMGSVIAGGVVLLLLIVVVAFWFLKGKKLFGDQSEPELTEEEIKLSITKSFGENVWPYPTNDEFAIDGKLTNKLWLDMYQLKLKIMQKGRKVPKTSTKKKLIIADDTPNLAVQGELEVDATHLVDLYAALYDLQNSNVQQKKLEGNVVPDLLFIIYKLDKQGHAVACKKLEGEKFFASTALKFLYLETRPPLIEVYNSIEYAAAQTLLLPEKSSHT